MPQSANKLLAALTRRDYQRLRPLLRTLDLRAEMTLPHCGQTRVYFPGTSLCSIITQMSDGSGIEVACIGSEGVVGLNTLTGETPANRNGFVQVGNGTVEYLPVVLFERELARNGRFREVVDQFCHTFLETVIQAVACNRLHSTHERCCKWLLNVHERIGRGRFELRARFLARAMGVKNSEIAGILSALEAQELITHDGDSITILDPIGLRRQTCGCYHAPQRASATALDAPKPPPEDEQVRSARVLQMRPASGVCTQCGSVTNLPHTSTHACILAVDQEIAGLVQRTHTLRKYRAQLLASRAQLYRDILKRSTGRI
jgi:hypothetical protein